MLLAWGAVRPASEFGKDSGGWGFSCKQDVVVLLLFVDIVDVSLDFGKLLFEDGPLLREYFLALRNSGIAFLAKFGVVLHLLDTEAASFQTVQTDDPCNGLVVEDAMIASVSPNRGNEFGIAVEFQRFIVHAGEFACLLHRVHGFHCR